MKPNASGSAAAITIETRSAALVTNAVGTIDTKPSDGVIVVIFYQFDDARIVPLRAAMVNGTQTVSSDST